MITKLISFATTQKMVNPIPINTPIEFNSSVKYDNEFEDYTSEGDWDFPNGDVSMEEMLAEFIDSEIGNELSVDVHFGIPINTSICLVFGQAALNRLTALGFVIDARLPDVGKIIFCRGKYTSKGKPRVTFIGLVNAKPTNGNVLAGLVYAARFRHVYKNMDDNIKSRKDVITITDAIKRVKNKDLYGVPYSDDRGFNRNLFYIDITAKTPDD